MSVAINRPPTPKLLGDRIEDHYKGSGRAGDGVTGATGHGDHDTGDDGGIEAVLRRYAAGDGQCHGERDGDDAHRHTGDKITAEAGHAVGFINTGLA